MLYLDSSALVKLLVREAETDALRRTTSMGRPQLYSSQVAVTEVVRALHARGYPEQARAAADPSGHALFVPGGVVRALPLTGAIAVAAGELAPGSALRSLDAIHVATAQALQPHLAGVVTYDARMARAARDAGLRVLSPGTAS